MTVEERKKEFFKVCRFLSDSPHCFQYDMNDYIDAGTCMETIAQLEKMKWNI